MHENADEIEPSLVELLGKLAPCDLVLIEGFKREPFPKIEVFRHSAGKPPLHPEDSSIIAIATDSLGPPSPVPLLDLNDAEAVAQFVLERAIAADRLIAPC
jgi:molybdopterin-guanine dinucleotide biosynthesis protein B